jgi:deoxyribose-phosphate aldolase
MTDPAVIDLNTALSWCHPAAAGRPRTVPGAEQRPGSAADVDALIGLVDLTSLEGADTPAKIAELCERAKQPDPGNPAVGPVAAVCVYPSLVPIAVEHTAGSPVAVASVAGAFPSGLSPLPVRVADIEAAVAARADEIDIVLNRSAFLSGDYPTVHHELVASIEAARGRPVKVILEVGELVEPSKIQTAAILAMAAGARFVKTSTGKIAQSATPEAVACMIEAASRFHQETGRRVGIKVSGGVRTVAQAAAYRLQVVEGLGDAWSDRDSLRFGASGLLDSLVQARRELA